MAFRFIFKPPPYENLLKDFSIITESFFTGFVSSCEKKRSEFNLIEEVSVFFFFGFSSNRRRLWSCAFPVVETRSLFFPMSLREQRYLWGSSIWSHIHHSSWMKCVCCSGPLLPLIDVDAEKWQNEKWPLPDRPPALRQLNGHLVWLCENTSTLWKSLRWWCQVCTCKIRWNWH